MTATMTLPETDRVSPAAPLLDVRDLSKHFAGRKTLFAAPRPVTRAVERLNLQIGRGEVLGLVGESGSGKTTAGRTILRLMEPTSGSVHFDGIDLGGLDKAGLRAMRRRMQIIFQDPYASLDPRRTVHDIIGEAHAIHGLSRAGAEREEMIGSLLEQVGLPRAALWRYPHEFSGGQRQRIGIARALAVQPDFIVADEPVSALDVSIQAQVINILLDQKARLGLTMLFIAHDLAVVEHASDRVAVMYLGRVMEIAPTARLYSAPRHPYTRALMSVVPQPRPDPSRPRQILQGDIPSPMRPPSGCVFRTRCPMATADCAAVVPPLEEVAPGHFRACIRD